MSCASPCSPARPMRRWSSTSRRWSKRPRTTRFSTCNMRTRASIRSCARLRPRGLPHRRSISIRWASEEQALIAMAAQFPRIVESAALNREPHRIAFYLGDLAAAFHAFFNLGNDRPDKRIVMAHDPETSAARLFMAQEYRAGYRQRSVADGGGGGYADVAAAAVRRGSWQRNWGGRMSNRLDDGMDDDQRGQATVNRWGWMPMTTACRGSNPPMMRRRQ